MKKILLLGFVMVGSSLALAQSNFDREQRRGKLFFSTGMQYRITPISDEGTPTFLVPVSRDAQLSGPVLNLTLDYFITRDLSIGFTHGFRYDEVTNFGENTDEVSQFEAASNTLINSQHIYLDYHFKVFKDSELFVRVGRSLLNNGTGYIERGVRVTEDGSLIPTFRSERNLTFKPAHFAVGYKKDRINMIVGTYISTNNPFSLGNNPLYIPYLEFKYSLFKL